MCEDGLQFQEQIVRLGKSEAEAVRSRRSEVPLKDGDLEALRRAVCPYCLDEDRPLRSRHQSAFPFEWRVVTDGGGHPQLRSTLTRKRLSRG